MMSDGTYSPIETKSTMRLAATRAGTGYCFPQSLCVSRSLSAV